MADVVETVNKWVVYSTEPSIMYVQSAFLCLSFVFLQYSINKCLCNLFSYLQEVFDTREQYCNFR